MRNIIVIAAIALGLAALSRLARSTCRTYAFAPSPCENTPGNGASHRSSRTLVNNPGRGVPGRSPAGR